MRRQTINVALIAALILAAGATLSIAQEDPHRPGAPHAEAAPELEQFAFLVGEWEAVGYQRTADGARRTGVALWRIGYILGGFALQDEWTYTNADGRTGFGTMYRSFDRAKGQWTIVEQTSPETSFHYMTARREGDTMVMEGEVETANGAILARRVFHNISPDYFDWRYDISRDGGLTWDEGVATMQCTRVR